MRGMEPHFQSHPAIYESVTKLDRFKVLSLRYIGNTRLKAIPAGRSLVSLSSAACFDTPIASFKHPPNESEDNGGRPFIRTSPSLSELSVQAIPWPSNLVDLSQLPQDTLASPPRGAAKTLFMADAAHPVPFHKAWSSPGKATDSPTGHPITPLYISSPSSAFETRKSSHDANCPRPS
ncbi:hypothetical protein BD310DRAFT_977011 [Dichomitus squalens]|uniref:Uncharacterized protein n=1 Tax=Dichomitus squalens TaxID=114155 RepID=A0A4Q9PX67_9APHY|nr:hypothetical protein BD310DRAFT_977011 [Dichomitus squalens]